MPRPKKPHSPFRYFNSSPEVIRLVVMMYVRFPLSLRLGGEGERCVDRRQVAIRLTAPSERLRARASWMMSANGSFAAGPLLGLFAVGR